MLIVFDGCDGVGKGTMLERANAYLKAQFGDDFVVRSKEPGGTELGNLIREIMFEKFPIKKMAPGVVDLLFLASHLQNLEDVVLPAVDEKIVLCDRWPYSQFVYAKFRDVPPSIVHAYKDLGGKRRANIFIFLHGDPAVCYSRAKARTTETHQSAKAWNDVKTFGKIQDEYFKQFSSLPEWRPIYVGTKSVDEVWKEVQEVIYVKLCQEGLI